MKYTKRRRGTIRYPASTLGSILELSASAASVLKYYVRPDGTPHGDPHGQLARAPLRRVEQLLLLTTTPRVVYETRFHRGLIARAETAVSEHP
jgi:hypothetical protein